MDSFNCYFCKITFLAYTSSRRTYCSKICFWANRRGTPVLPLVLCYCGTKVKRRDRDKYCSWKCAALLRRGVPSWNKGKKLSKDHCIKMSLARKGKPSPTRGKTRPDISGVNHPLWAGGYQKKLANNRQRRVMKKGNGGTHSLEEWLLLKKLYKDMCLCCKKQEPYITLTEDHIIPLKLGGTDDIKNIQPLCKSCNSRKSIKTTNYLLENTFLERMVN